MDQITSIISSFGLVAVGLVVFALAVVVLLYIKNRYMIADANQALVITGDKVEPKILVGGGAFVPPFRKGDFFDLGQKTVQSTNEATHTNTMIPVIVEWTAQLRADTSRDEKGVLNQSLRNAILGFTNYEGDVADSLQQTLEGEVRAVIATMTPEDLVRNKASFTEQVDTNVRDTMAELGFKLVSLNIGKVTDPNGYYDNLAAKDREEKRREAANLKADADQGISVRSAEADEASKAAEQRRDLALAEQQRNLALRRAAIQVETETAEANAQVAGELQREIRNQELAARRGEVEVVQEKQRQAAATARRDVVITEAETARQRAFVEAEAEKEQAEIAAQAEARQAEIAAEAEATVAERRASGQARAAREEAQGRADAINLTAEAEADKVRKTGMAQADVDRAQGEAEAAAIRAKGEADADVQRKMAEALAANDGANLRVTLAEIERDTRITVSTNLGQVMAHLGENATFIDMGGNGSGDGDLLTGLLGRVPELFKMLDVKSEALNGTPFGAALGTIIADAKEGSPSRASDSVVVTGSLASPDASDENTAADEVRVDDDAEHQEALTDDDSSEEPPTDDDATRVDAE